MMWWQCGYALGVLSRHENRHWQRFRMWIDAAPNQDPATEKCSPTSSQHHAPPASPPFTQCKLNKETDPLEDLFHFFSSSSCQLSSLNRLWLRGCTACSAEEPREEQLSLTQPDAPCCRVECVLGAMEYPELEQVTHKGAPAKAGAGCPLWS